MKKKDFTNKSDELSSDKKIQALNRRGRGGDFDFQRGERPSSHSSKESGDNSKLIVSDSFHGGMTGEFSKFKSELLIDFEPESLSENSLHSVQTSTLDDFSYDGELFSLDVELERLSSGDFIVNGRYLLLEKLKELDHLELYRAEDKKFGGTYLLLFFRVDRKDEVSFFEIIKEYKLIQKMRHPALPTVFSLDECVQTGRLYAVVEEVKGVDLYTFFEGKGDLKERWLFYLEELYLPILEVVDYLHRQGIFHLNLNLSTLGVETGDSEQVRFYTYGKSFKWFSWHTVVRDKLDLFFISPEQLKDSSEIISPFSSDIFSLGIILYYILTGQLPFGVAYTPSSLNSSIPPELDLIVQKASAANWQERYSSAEELGEDIKTFLQEFQWLKSHGQEIRDSEYRHLNPFSSANKSLTPDIEFSEDSGSYEILLSANKNTPLPPRPGVIFYDMDGRTESRERSAPSNMTPSPRSRELSPSSSEKVRPHTTPTPLSMSRPKPSSPLRQNLSREKSSPSPSSNPSRNSSGAGQRDVIFSGGESATERIRRLKRRLSSKKKRDHHPLSKKSKLFTGYKVPITSIACPDNSQLLLTATESGFLSIWDRNLWVILQDTYPLGSQHPILSIEIEPSEEFVAFAGLNSVAIWRHYSPLQEFQTADSPVFIGWSPSDGNLYIVEANGNVSSWNKKLRRLKLLWEGESPSIRAALHPSRPLLFAVSESNRLSLFNLEREGLSFTSFLPFNMVTYIGVMDHKTLIIGDNSGKIYLWDFNKRRNLHNFKLHSEEIVKVVRGGRDLFISLDKGGTVHFWNRKGESVYPPLEGTFTQLETSSREKLLFLGDREGQVEIRELPRD